MHEKVSVLCTCPFWEDVWFGEKAKISVVVYNYDHRLVVSYCEVNFRNIDLKIENKLHPDNDFNVRY